MKRNSGKNDLAFPLYCDFSCQHAEFSDPSAVGACRRDIGVWCGKAGRYHNKNARCLFRILKAANGKKKIPTGRKKTPGDRK